jgi:hypothetical protein
MMELRKSLAKALRRRTGTIEELSESFQNRWNSY